jgi:hypothetical protein
MIRNGAFVFFNGNRLVMNFDVWAYSDKSTMTLPIVFFSFF